MKHIVFDCDGTLLDTSRRDYCLYPGIPALLEQLSQEHQLYVWTARGHSSTLRHLTELGVIQYFQKLATPDSAHLKPHIGGLVNLLGPINKASICVIGDSSNDMLGAKRFGVCAIGAVWNTETRADILLAAGADFIVSHPAECSKLIQLNLKGDNDV